MLCSITGCGKTNTATSPEIINKRLTIETPAGFNDVKTASTWKQDVETGTLMSISSPEFRVYLDKGNLVYASGVVETESITDVKDKLEEVANIRIGDIESLSENLDEMTGITCKEGPADAQLLLSTSDYEDYNGSVRMWHSNGKTGFVYVGQCTTSEKDYERETMDLLKKAFFRSYDLRYNIGESVEGKAETHVNLSEGQTKMKAVPYKGRPGSASIVDARVTFKSQEEADPKNYTNIKVPSGKKLIKASFNIDFPGCDVTNVIPRLYMEAADEKGVTLDGGSRAFEIENESGDVTLLYCVPQNTKKITINIT